MVNDDTVLLDSSEQNELIFWDQTLVRHEQICGHFLISSRVRCFLCAVGDIFYRKFTKNTIYNSNPPQQPQPTKQKTQTEIPQCSQREVQMERRLSVPFISVVQIAKTTLVPEISAPPGTCQVAHRRCWESFDQLCPMVAPYASHTLPKITASEKLLEEKQSDLVERKYHSTKKASQTSEMWFRSKACCKHQMWLTAWNSLGDVGQDGGCVLPKGWHRTRYRKRLVKGTGQNLMLTQTSKRRKNTLLDLHHTKILPSFFIFILAMYTLFI